MDDPRENLAQGLAEAEKAWLWGILREEVGEFGH